MDYVLGPALVAGLVGTLVMTVLMYMGALMGMRMNMPLYVRPLLGRFMREHTLEMQRTVEARAEQSRRYPPPTCRHDQASRA